MATISLLDLPVDILTTLPEYLANLEDYKNLASTCRSLRRCMAEPLPNTILRLAAAQTDTFFRPSPYFLVCATAAQLGQWARQSDENEQIFQEALERGIDGVMTLALEHCGLTMQRVRELHLMRFSIINPVTNIMDQCCGDQWYDVDDFWNGGRSDAYTIHADAPVSFFHLAIYGELFAPDLLAMLDQDTTSRRLSVDTRLDYIKYICYDFATDLYRDWAQEVANGRADARRAVKRTGPYTRPKGYDASSVDPPHFFVDKNYNLALTWTIKSSRWKPHWKVTRELAGEEFDASFQDEWWGPGESEGPDSWRQRMWENVCICQGLEGLGIMLPQQRAEWVDKMQQWRRKIAKLDKEPDKIQIGRQATLDYPFLLGDLRICASGYVGGT